MRVPQVAVQRVPQHTAHHVAHAGMLGAGHGNAEASDQMSDILAQVWLPKLSAPRPISQFQAGMAIRHGGVTAACPHMVWHLHGCQIITVPCIHSWCAARHWHNIQAYALHISAIPRSLALVLQHMCVLYHACRLPQTSTQHAMLGMQCCMSAFRWGVKAGA